MKYQFKVNGKVVSAKELYELCLSDYWYNEDEFKTFIDDLLLGKVIDLDDFMGDNTGDKLQLVEVK